MFGNIGNKKPKKLVVEVPESREQAEELAKVLAEEIRAAQRTASVVADQISALKAKLKAEDAPKAKARTAMLLALQAWATANRPELTDQGKRKSVQLGAGTASWRTSPPKLEIDDVDALIVVLQGLDRDDCVRITEEIDKDVLKNDPELLKQLTGVRITQTELFKFAPADCEDGIETSVSARRA